MKKAILIVCVAAVMGLGSVAMAADVFNMPTGLTSLETVTVGNVGNAADTTGAPNPCGAVAYEYNIGKYEVTAGQYCEFLNAVAKTDTYGLYDDRMEYGCNIRRSGLLDNYSYSIPDVVDGRSIYWVNRPAAIRVSP